MGSTRHWKIFRAICFAGVVVLLVFPGSTGTSGEVPRYTRLSVPLGPGDLIRLAAAGMPVEHGVRRGAGDIELILSPAEIIRLRDLGFSPSVLDDDVARTYADRARHHTLRLPSHPSSLVQRFRLGSMGGFLTLAELEIEVASMQAAFPLLISGRDTIGFSVENRPIWAVKISRNPSIDEPEPRVLYTALHHAREPQGMMTLLLTMWYLLEHYGSDEAVTEILDHRELFFVPALNPDGYLYNQSTNPDGGGMWRKNRRRNVDGSYGVDLNRNYGVQWGRDNVGSSVTPSFDTYRGTGPFSEPETAAIREFCMRKGFSAALNYHSYANVLIHPWGYNNTHTPDSALFLQLGDLLTRRNYYVYGTGAETIGYPTNGGADDWMYGDTVVKPVIYSMTPEVGSIGDGFWPAPGQIAPLAEQNLQANLSLARLAGESFSVEVGSITQKRDNDTVSISLSLRSVGVAQPSPGVTVQFEGAAGEQVSPSSVFVSTASVSPIPVLFRRDRTKPDGSWATLLLRTSSVKGRGHDSVSFRLGVPSIAFEDSVDTLDGTWAAVSTLAGAEWNITGTRAFSGSYSYTDSPEGEYQPNLSSVLTLKKPIPLAGSAAELRFRSRWDIEAAYDIVLVEGSADQGQTWKALSGKFTRPGSGAAGGKQVPGVPGLDRIQRDWVEEVMDLQHFLGTDFLLRFRLDTDSFDQRDGIFVDDIRILLYRALPLAVEPVTTPLVTQLFQNYPNPFNGETRIRFTLGEAAGHDGERTRVTVKVFDILGREVATAVDGLLVRGEHVVVFDARRLASGLYWYRLQNGLTSATRSMVLVR